MAAEETNNGFHTVGQLRKLMEGLPDEQGILGQTVATNGDAWQMWLRFIPKHHGYDFSQLQMHHPELRFMHPRFDLEQLTASSENLKRMIDEETDYTIKEIIGNLHSSLECAISKLIEYEYIKNRASDGQPDDTVIGGKVPEEIR